jgi:hypothetical protein
MATSLNRTGLKPAATTLTTLYTCSINTQAVVSNFIVCNLSTVAGYFRIAVRRLSASIDDSHYLYYDQYIAPNDSYPVVIGQVLLATDIVSVYSDTGNLVFNISLQENI